MTRYFLRHRLSASLPRKFKIGFEGCPEDHVKAAINDIGWIGRVQNGRRGFRVLVGGGTATMAVSGRLLFDFLPGRGDAERRRGDRARLSRARRLQAQGPEPDEVPHEVARVGPLARGVRSRAMQRSAPRAACRCRSIRARCRPKRRQRPAARSPVGRGGRRARARGRSARARHPTRAAAGARGGPRRLCALGERRTCTSRNRTGYVAAVVTVPLGDLTSAQFRVLADLSLAYADGTLRVTPTQNLVFRWVKQRGRAGALRTAGGDGPGAAGRRHDCRRHELPGRRVVQARRHAVARAGALSHRLRARQSRADRARAVARRQGQRLPERLRPASHRGRRVSRAAFASSTARAVPQYFVMVGGGVDVDGATFGRLVAKIPARRGPHGARSARAPLRCRTARGRNRRARSSIASMPCRSRSCSRISSR